MRITRSKESNMMRKVLISAAAAAVSALAFAAPAAAQWAPAWAPAPYGYNGYNNNYGGVRSLQVRVDQLQRQINRLAQRGAISRNEYNGLQRDARSVEKRLAQRSRNGLNHREYADLQNRISWLERRISNEVRDGHRYGYNGQNGWVDRDRDGRNDRYEDDGGWRHD
jgi:hypothetical protein